MVADMVAETLVEMVCSEISFLLLLNFSLFPTLKGLGADGLNGGEDELGRLGHGGTQGGSRPASTLGSRPGSSMRKFGSRGSSRRGMRRNVGAEVTCYYYYS